jgi:SAM-dependent methyltransferase
MFEGWQAEVAGRSLRLLDVACGSGKFPAALVDHAGLGAAAISPVDYALLDPSAFSIAEARGALRPPFSPGAEYHCTLQDLDCPQGAFDIVWATHALYAVPPQELDTALARLLRVTGRFAFIAHGCADGHYVRFHQLFLEDFRGGAGTPYTSAEQILEALARLGATVTTMDIVYTNGAAADAGGQVEGFLQRCVFDDTVTLADLLEGPRTGPYLAACREDGAFRFHQHVKLIVIDGAPAHAG